MIGMIEEGGKRFTVWMVSDSRGPTKVCRVCEKARSVRNFDGNASACRECAAAEYLKRIDEIDEEYPALAGNHEIEDGQKICPACSETKSVDEFGKNRAQNDGLQAQCKECRNAAKRKLNADKGRRSGAGARVLGNAGRSSLPDPEPSLARPTTTGRKRAKLTAKSRRRIEIEFEKMIEVSSRSGVAKGDPARVYKTARKNVRGEAGKIAEMFGVSLNTVHKIRKAAK